VAWCSDARLILGTLLQAKLPQLAQLAVEGMARALVGMGELPAAWDFQQVELPEFMVPFEDEPRVIELMESGQAVLLSGMGGIGKTRLAKSVFSRLQGTHPTMPACYVSVDWASASPSNAELLNVLQTLLEKLAFVKAVPDGLQEGRALLARNLKGKNVLLVVDNARVSHLRSLLTCKDEHGKTTSIMDLLAPGSMVLITSRSRLSAHPFHGCQGLEEVRMQFLPKPQARQLLMSHAGISPTADLGAVLDAALDRCGGLPLAVEVAGTSLKRNKKGLLKEGQDDKGYLDEEALLHAYDYVPAATGYTLMETLRLTWEEDIAGGVGSTLLDIVRGSQDGRCLEGHLERLEERCLVNRRQGAHGVLEPGAWVPNTVVDFCKIYLGCYMGDQGRSAVEQEAIKCNLQMMQVGLAQGLLCHTRLRRAVHPSFGASPACLVLTLLCGGSGLHRPARAQLGLPGGDFGGAGQVPVSL
jgi:hypothetical protein